MDFLVRGGQLFSKTSNAVVSGFHVQEKDFASINNFRHAVFRPVIHSDVIADAAVLKHLEGKICEFQYIPAKGSKPAQWVLYKERPDKLSANSYLGAQ